MNTSRYHPAPDGKDATLTFEPQKAAFQPRNASLRLLHRMEGPLESRYPTGQASSFLGQFFVLVLQLPEPSRIGTSKL